MGSKTSINGMLILALLAFVGFLLVYIPPQIVAQYRVVAELGNAWVIAYFSLVGIGAVLLLASTGWTLWRLWRHTRQKRQRRTKHAQSPSQLSREQQQAGDQGQPESYFPRLGLLVLRQFPRQD